MTYIIQYSAAGNWYTLLGIDGLMIEFTSLSAAITITQLLIDGRHAALPWHSSQFQIVDSSGVVCPVL